MSMNKYSQQLPDEPCRKYGGNTTIQFIPSTGMDIEPTEMKRTCVRYGYFELVKSLDEEKI